MDSVTYRDSARLKLINMTITKTELLLPIILVSISELSINTNIAPFTHDANHKLYPGKLLLEVCRRKKLWSNSKIPVN